MDNDLEMERSIAAAHERCQNDEDNFNNNNNETNDPEETEEIYPVPEDGECAGSAQQTDEDRATENMIRQSAETSDGNDDSDAVFAFKCKLIEAVQMHNVIYDLAHPDHMKDGPRAVAWDDIVMAMDVDPNNRRDGEFASLYGNIINFNRCTLSLATL